MMCLNSLTKTKHEVAMTAFEMYVFVKLTTIQNMCIAFAFILGIALIFIIPYTISIYDGDADDNTAKAVMRFMKTAIALFVFFLLSAVFIPSTKEMAAIYIFPKMASNEQVQQIGKDSLDILTGYAEKWKQEILSEIDKTKQQ